MQIPNPVSGLHKDPLYSRDTSGSTLELGWFLPEDETIKHKGKKKKNQANKVPTVYWNSASELYQELYPFRTNKGNLTVIFIVPEFNGDYPFSSQVHEDFQHPCHF